MNSFTAEELVQDTSIANRAMKAVFHRGSGAGRRVRDVDAENLVKSTLGDQGQIVTRKLFTNKQGLVHRRNVLATQMYEYHKKATLPLGDDGSRLLPNAMYFEYTQEMGNLESQLKVMDVQLVANYDYLVQQDINERNSALMVQGKPGTATTLDYPDVATMKRYLYITWLLEPVATGNDFRFQVDPTLMQRLNDRLTQVETDATLAIFDRMVDPMRKFVAKLSVPIGTEGAVFRDSLLGNLNELSYLKKMNVNNDPRVSEMLDELEKVIKPYVFAPDALREQPEARQSARDKMAELVKKLDGYNFGV